MHEDITKVKLNANRLYLNSEYRVVLFYSPSLLFLKFTAAQ